MTTLHIENKVHDYDEWKVAFDKFDRLRADQGVRSYRVARGVEDPSQITVDLEFDSVHAATDFRGILEKIWATPQSREQLISHCTPVILDVVEVHTF